MSLKQFFQIKYRPPQPRCEALGVVGLVVVGGVGGVVRWCHVGVYGVPCLVDNSVEPVVVICGVRDCADGAVGLDQTVLPLDYVTVSLLPLVLDVTGVIVLHPVVVGVLWVCLEIWLVNDGSCYLLCTVYLIW